MTELERHKEAMAVAMVALKSVSANMTAFEALEDIDRILTPPQEFKDVEVSAGWVNIYEKTAAPGRLLGVYTFATKEEADKAATEVSADRIDCQEIKTTIRRAVPQKVERSVSIEAEINGNYRHPLGYVFGKSEGVAAYNKVAFYDHPECHGKRGVLTFTWTE